MGLIDVAPTILHHYGLPIGKDMDGKVILDIFERDPRTCLHREAGRKQPGDFGDLRSDHSKQMPSLTLRQWSN